jgi:glycosyltransferase involved in cell wall biosynthesis
MKKIGICGHFNLGSKPVGGQTIRTRSLAEQLEKAYGPDQVLKVDTANWKRKAPILFFRCLSMALHSEHIIILPAKNGVKLLLPLFVLLAGILRKRLHYVIIGAWLPNMLKQYPILRKALKKVDCIYGQTDTLLHKLSDLGIEANTYLLPNFKSCKPEPLCLKEEKHRKPYRLCIISRVNQKKGIESAVRVIGRINREEKQANVLLDIYGPIEESYRERFYRILNRYPDFVKYKGVLDSKETSEVIKDYYLMLFPTGYYTEGFPGAILDAYFSGLPVLASRWESGPDVIREGITGYTYEFNQEEDFYHKLNFLLQNEQMVMDMRKHCLREAEKYEAENVMKIMLGHINCRQKKGRKKSDKDRKKVHSKGRKRIGLLIPNLHAGGSERVISFLSRHLTEAGYEVFLLLFDGGQISYPYRGTLIAMNCKSGKNIIHKGFIRLLRIVKLSFIMKRYDLDLIISFLYAANAVNCYAIGKARRIIACRGYRDYMRNGRTYAKMLKKVDLLLVQTERMKEAFVRDYRVSKAKLRVLGNPFPIKEIREKAREPIEADILKFIVGHKTLCTVGSFKKDKGYWHLIRIFPAVKKAVPEAGLIFIGNRGEMEAEIKTMAARTPCAKDILFLGYQANPFKYVAKCALYVSTSIYEGFPNAIVEAMACGVPVIATDCKTGPREILCQVRRDEKGKAAAQPYGILVPELSDRISFDIAGLEEEEEHMAKEIIRLLQEGNSLEYWKKASLKRSEEFDCQAFSSLFLSLID